MEYNISKLMELIEDDTVRLERRNDVSPQKIKETVMNKIHSENKTSRPSRRWGRTLLIAAIIVCLALAGAVAAGADPLSIFGQATEKQRLDADYRQEQYETTIAEGREYHEPYLTDELDLDAIPTENDVVQVIEGFTRTPVYLDTGGGEPYEGPELEGCRVHLKESYYDGTNLRLGIALETLDGDILYPVEGLDGTFSSVEEEGVPKQQYYFTDHIRLTDGTDVGIPGYENTTEGVYINFLYGLEPTAQNKDELEICIRIRSKYDTPVAYYTYEPGQEPVGNSTPVAEAEVVFVIPNTAK